MDNNVIEACNESLIHNCIQSMTSMRKDRMTWTFNCDLYDYIMTIVEML
jgi:hypothetical protein